MFNKMAIKHAKKRREDLLQVLPSMKVRPGWIKYIRSLLGMTLKELGTLADVSLSTVAQAEKREAEGKVTIETLNKIAKAMECEFVYAFVPKEDISDMLKKKAMEKAKRSILRADTHMSLEDQKVQVDLNSRVETLAQKLIEKGKVW
ncbi:helix-turn-helix domain-containing protein [bacterium]|nr:helix-turn-helix domain-containing protein [bacterium]